MFKVSKTKVPMSVALILKNLQNKKKMWHFLYSLWTYPFCSNRYPDEIYICLSKVKKMENYKYDSDNTIVVQRYITLRQHLRQQLSKQRQTGKQPSIVGLKIRSFWNLRKDIKGSQTWEKSLRMPVHKIIFGKAPGWRSVTLL